MTLRGYHARRTGSVALAVGLLFGSAFSASAQQAEQMASVDTGAGGIADIVVTAQRRAERMQDVPISISAVTSDNLTQYGVAGTLDLAQAVPGFLVQQRNINATPYLRGVGNDNGSPGDEPAVAVYVDGVYRASSSGSVFSLNNIERVEVLKGPQGTLFGRNAVAGVINVITRDPQYEPHAEIRVGYANYDTRTGDFYVTGGLTQSLAVDFSVYYRDQDKGWGTNLATGGDAYKGSAIALRNKWKLDLGDTVFTLIGDWSKDRFIAGPGTTPGMLEGQRSILDGKMYYAGIYNINTEINPFLNVINYGASLKIEHDFGWAQFVSISAFRRAKANMLADSDATPLFTTNPGIPGATAIVFGTTTNDRQYTQEIQLLAPSGSALQWIVGAFYLDSRQSPTSTITTPLGVTRRSAELPNTSLAFFGQATYEIFQDTNLTLGARYSIDKRERSTVLNGVSQIDLFPKAEFKRPTWRIAIDHKFAPDILAYASYNRGFKAGLYEFATNVRDAIRPQTVDAFEVGLKTQFFDRRLLFNIAAYHSDIKNLQISATAPAGTSTILFNAAKARINGLDVEIVAKPIDNLQLSASATFLDGKFVSFPGANMFRDRTEPAQFAGYGSIQFVGDATGLVTNNTPKRAINLSAQYTIPTAFGRINLRASDSYTSAYFLSSDQRHDIEARHLVAASASLTSPDDSWEFRLWVQNAFDKQYYVNITARTGGDVGIAGAPRTYGASIGVKF